jgi:hypothetical protein
MFFIARVSSLNVDVDAGEETLGRLRRLAKFFNTGLLGAYHHDHCCVYRMAACGIGLPSYAFLSNPFTYIFLRICLFGGYWSLPGPGFSLGTTRRCWLPAR